KFFDKSTLNFINVSQFLRVILPPAVKDESPCIGTFNKPQLASHKKTLTASQLKMIVVLFKCSLTQDLML
ncbi:unnamed protein product, partial [Tenebrio molitor]